MGKRLAASAVHSPTFRVKLENLTFLAPQGSGVVQGAQVFSSVVSNAHKRRIVDAELASLCQHCIFIITLSQADSHASPHSTKPAQFSVYSHACFEVTQIRIAAMIRVKAYATIVAIVRYQG